MIGKILILIGVLVVGYAIYSSYYGNTQTLDVEQETDKKQTCINQGNYYIDRTNSCMTWQQLPEHLIFDASKYVFNVAKYDYVKLVVCYYEDDEITVLDCAKITG